MGEYASKFHLLKLNELSVLEKKAYLIPRPSRANKYQSKSSNSFECQSTSILLFRVTLFRCTFWPSHEFNVLGAARPVEM